MQTRILTRSDVKKCAWVLLGMLLSSSALAVCPDSGRQPALETLRPGDVQPAGWLRDWCQTAKDGYLGRLDEIDEHFRIAWTTNCMRRGKHLHWGDAHRGSWSAEGGAYWFDGLVRLAWQLDDDALKDYVRKRLDTVLDRMHPHAIAFLHWLDRRDPAQIEEMCVSQGFSVWASALFSRAVAAYYRASGDPRAIRALNWAFNDVRFFEFGNGKAFPAAAWEVYRLGRDPAVGAALDDWCAKGPDDKFITWRYAHSPTHMEFKPFTQKDHDWRAQHGVLACETALSALRTSFWRTGKPEWGENVLAWRDYILGNCLQPTGVPVADESFGFAGPDRGTETCTVAADIHLNIEFLSLFGRGCFGDRVERALFNAGAACTTAEFFKHVYVQTPNRTVVENRGDFTCPVSARYYLKKNWPLCCTASLCRYLPDFVQHLWMKTPDGGLVATMYAPNVLTTSLGKETVCVRTETDYPFGETLKLTVEPSKPLSFPLKLRLPGWCAAPAVAVNGKPVRTAGTDGFVSLVRTWTSGDVVTFTFPMKPVVETGLDRNKGDPGVPWCAVSAGPLLFARHLEGMDENTLRPNLKTDWRLNPSAVAAEAKLVWRTMPGKWCWTPDRMPVRMIVPTDSGKIELVPYGSANLRLSMFPVTVDAR